MRKNIQTKRWLVELSRPLKMTHHPRKAKIATKNKKTTDLTKAEEESMPEWKEANYCLYNKKLYTYKDKQKKDKL